MQLSLWQNRSNTRPEEVSTCVYLKQCRDLVGIVDDPEDALLGMLIEPS